MDAPPAPSSTFAPEGVAMHDLAARCLIENLDPKAHASESMAADAVEATAFYVEFVRANIARASWHGIERRLRFDDHLFGTTDYIGVTEPVLDIIDLKGGASVLVAAEGNSQMKTYAWLAWQDEQVREHARRCASVRTTIVQPRAPNGPTRTTEFGVEELVAWGIVLKRAMRAATNALAPFKTGTHCRWCPASPICPTLKTQGDMARNRDPKGMTGKELAEWLDMADVLEAWILGVEPYVPESISVAQADKALKANFSALPVEPKPVEPRTEARTETEQVIEKAKRGRPAKAQVESVLNRDQLIDKLRGAVQSNYEACEVYLNKIGKESFLTLSDTELAAACLELVK
jgi:hypothetical protein